MTQEKMDEEQADQKRMADAARFQAACPPEGRTPEPSRATRQAIDDATWLHEVFSYHAPTGLQPAHYEAIRAGAQIFARTILEHVPACADRTAALRKVREAVMTANAAVALNGLV